MLTRYAYQYSLLPLINGPAPAPVEAEVEAEAAPDRSPSLRSPIHPGMSASPVVAAEAVVALASSLRAAVAALEPGQAVAFCRPRPSDPGWRRWRRPTKIVA